MNSEQRCGSLVKKIVQILSEGLWLSEEVLHYMDSTFLNPSVKDLEQILGSDDSCEAQSLFQLIFFPDETFQVRLEDILESEDFRKEDEETMLAIIDRKPLLTTLYFPDNRGALQLAMPQSCAGPLISRLHVSKKLSPHLVEAIERCLPRNFRKRAKIKLRNSRFVHTESRVTFLCSFFEKTNTQADDFSDVFECLDVVFDLFHEKKDDPDIFQGLIAKKKFYFKSLQMAKRYESRLANTTMETMMLPDTM